jgi:uncharacterized protein DUF6266
LIFIFYWKPVFLQFGINNDCQKSHCQTFKTFNMAKIENGIGGGFSGKVGPVVGINYRGINVIRSLPQKSATPPSEKQLAQRLRFGCVTRFLTPVCPMLQLYFGQPEGSRSRRSIAISYHVMEAVTGIYPNFKMDYGKVVLTMGHLPNIQQPSVLPLPNGAIAINWFDNSTQVLAKPGDKLLVVLYNETRNTFKMIQDAQRSDGQLTVTVSNEWAGETVHCWLTFTAAIGTKCATSTYAGAFRVM